MKTGKFTHYAVEAEQRKNYAMQRENGLSGNGMIPHDLWRRVVPIAREYDKSNADIALLYSYLVSNVNGDRGNDRYMSAFTSVDRIAADTGIGRNRVAKLSSVLEASGLLRTAYDYSSNKRDKLYYPQYYTVLSDDEIRRKLDAIYC